MHRCNMCGQSDTKVMIEGPGSWFCCDPQRDNPFPYRIALCQHCGHVFGSWDRDRTTQYADDEYVTCDTDLELYATYVQFVLAGIPPMNRPPRILEIGLNRGALLQRFYDLSFECHGVEPGKQNVQAARARMPNAHIHEGFFGTEWADRFGDNSFDVVMLTSVFEHLPEPATILRAARTCLAPEGRLFLLVPDLANYTPTIQIPPDAEPTYGCSQLKFFYRNLFLTYAQHINHFSAVSLTRYLAALGFRTQQIATIGYLWVSATPADPADPSFDYTDIVEYHTRMMKHYQALLDRVRQSVIDRLAGKRLVCYGAGREFSYFLDTFAPLGVEVLAVADDNSTMDTVHGLPCVKPDALADFKPDFCLATSFDYENAIARKAVNLLPDRVEVQTLTQLLSHPPITLPRWTHLDPRPAARTLRDHPPSQGGIRGSTSATGQTGRRSTCVNANASHRPIPAL